MEYFVRKIIPCTPKFLIKNIINYFIGNYLLDELTEDQIVVIENYAQCTNIELNLKVINDNFEKQNIPLNVLYGYIGSIRIYLPGFSSEGKLRFEVSGLELFLGPAFRSTNPDPDVVFGTMVDSMINMQRSFHEEDLSNLIFEEKQKGKNFNALISKWISKLCLTMYNTKISFENRIIPQINRRCRFLCEIEKIEFATRDIDNANMGASALLGILLTNNIEFTGFVLSWEVASSKNDSTNGMTSLSTNEILYSSQILSIVNPVQVNYTLLLNSSEPEFEINITIDTVHVLLSPLPLHWIQVLLSQVVVTDFDPSISKNVKMTDSQFDSYFSNDEKLINSFKGQTNDSSIYFDTDSTFDRYSESGTNYDDVSLDNSDENDQFCEFQKDTATYASMYSNATIFDDDGKMNTNFKASVFTKNVCIKVLLHNPSNDSDNWDGPDDFMSHMTDHSNWECVSKKFFGLMKTVPKSIGSYEALKSFHIESGDIDFFSMYMSNVACSVLNKKFSNKFHKSLTFSTEELQFSETIYDSSKKCETMQVISIEGLSDAKAMDVKVEYNPMKNEMSLEIFVEKCYIGMDISLQDRIRPILQNNIIEYIVSDRTNSYELNKSTDSRLSVGCIAVVNISDISFEMFVPLVNLNEEMLSKCHWQYRLLHQETIQFSMKNSRCLCRIPASLANNDKDYNPQIVIELYSPSIIVSLFTAENQHMEIMNIVNNSLDSSTVVIKIKSKLENHLDTTQMMYSRQPEEESMFPYYYSKISKKTPFKPYSTKESSKSNSTTKVIHTPESEEKIKQYIQKSINNSYFDMEIVASTIILVINNKEILNVLYDRLMFDLTLWEPCFDKRTNDVIINYKSKDMSETDDDANTDNSFDDDANLLQMKSKSKFQSKKFTCKIESAFCRCYLQSTMDDLSESVVELQGVHVFTDSDIAQGLVEAQSMCIAEIELGKIFHTDKKVIESDSNRLRNMEYHLNNSYVCVLDRVPPHVIDCSVSDERNKILVMVMESKLSKIVKTSRSLYRAKQKSSTILTTNVNEICLRANYICENVTGFEWMQSMADLFSLNNPIITGYTFPDSDMSMYLHMKNCAIDLCFSLLPMSVFSVLNKVEIEMNLNSTESYYLCSEIGFSGSQIFIRPNSNVSLSKYFRWNNTNWLQYSLPDEGFVYVADLGSLDIKFTKIGSTNYTNRTPTCSLEVTNSETGIHLCADSLNLIVTCLTELMSSRTGLDPEPPPDSINGFSLTHNDSIRQVESTQTLNEKQTNIFNNMLKDARKEEANDKPTKKDNKRKAEEYYDDFELVDIFSNTHDHVVTLENGSSSKLSVVLDHYKNTSSENRYGKMKKAIFRDPEGYPNVENSLVVHDFSLSVYFYAGSDFCEENDLKRPSFKLSKTNSKPSVNVPIKFQRFNSDNKPKLTIDAKDFDAYFGEERSNSSVTRGGSNRNLHQAYQCKMSKINLRYAIFSTSNWQMSGCHKVSRRLVLIFNKMEIMSRNDRSGINKVMFCDTNALSWYDPKSPMVSMKMIFTLSDPNHDVVNEECDIKMSIQPIRLNIDQEVILFSEKFYKDLNVNKNLDPKPHRSYSTSALSESPHQEKDSILIPPNVSLNKELCLGRGGGIDSISGSSPLSRTSTIRVPAFDEMRSMNASDEKQPTVDTSRSISSVFIRNFSIYPDISVKLDYTGTRLDLTQGAIKGLFYIMMQLNNVVLTFKNKQYIEGITGLDILISILMNDISEEFYTQLTSIFSKVGPISEVTDILSGIYDFFTLPYQYYRNEGGLIEGIKLGTRSITTTSLWATLTLVSKGLKTFQKMAETTYDLVSPADIGRADESYHAARDIREGMTNAAQRVRRRIRDTASDLQHALVRSDRAFVGRIGDVIRQVPPALASPIVATCEATNQLVDGLRYQLKPEMKIEDEKKWKQ